MTERDHYGNVWAIEAVTGKFTVTPAQSGEPQPLAVGGRTDGWTSVATDDHGFIWVAGPGPQLYFSNPREVVDTETPDGSPKITKDDPTAFFPVDSMLLPPGCGDIVTLERHAESGAVVATFADGAVRELDVVGTDIGGPFTSGHGSDAAIVRDRLSPSPSEWRIHPARLPCGNHDIVRARAFFPCPYACLHLAQRDTGLCVTHQYASEAGGKLFVAGGVTHHRGFPAVSHAFRELLAFDGDSWRVHAEMYEGSCYSAVVGLPKLPQPEVWVIGGGGPTLPGPLATTQIFDASTGKRREGVPLPLGRLGCIGAAVRGRVYIIGGSGGFGGQGFDECLSISPGEQEWRHETPAPGGPLPAATLAGCELHGKIYVLGGTAIVSAIPIPCLLGLQQNF